MEKEKISYMKGFPQRDKMRNNNVRSRKRNANIEQKENSEKEKERIKAVIFVQHTESSRLAKRM